MSNLLRYAMCAVLLAEPSIGFCQDGGLNPVRSSSVVDTVDVALADIEALLVETATVPLSEREEALLRVVTVLDGELRHADVDRAISGVDPGPNVEVVTVETGEPVWRVILYVGAALVTGFGVGYGFARLSP